LLKKDALKKTSPVNDPVSLSKPDGPLLSFHATFNNMDYAECEPKQQSRNCEQRLQNRFPGWQTA
jgi:hypothetical protein